MIILICISAGLYLGCLYVFFRITFWNSDKRKATFPKLPSGPHYDENRENMQHLVDLMNAVPYEEVWITSYDGTRLFGRYIEVKKGAPLQIQFAGYRGAATRDMAGANRIARENGINTLLVDERAHGRSGGHVTTFGIRERRDCLAWIRYAEQRFGKDTPIVLAGVPMGAAVVLMAADLNLPESVKGIIADSPYTSPKDIICKVARDLKFPVRFVWSVLWQGARLYGRFDPNKSSALEAVTRTELPILLIHGDEDRFVPVEMSSQIASAGNNVQLEIFHGGAHGISYLADTERYWNLVLDFMKKVC